MCVWIVPRKAMKHKSCVPPRSFRSPENGSASYTSMRNILHLSYSQTKKKANLPDATNRTNRHQLSGHDSSNTTDEPQIHNKSNLGERQNPLRNRMRPKQQQNPHKPGGVDGDDHGDAPPPRYPSQQHQHQLTAVLPPPPRNADNSRWTGGGSDEKSGTICMLNTEEPQKVFLLQLTREQ